MVLESGKITNLMKFKIKAIAGDASFRKFYRVSINKKKKIIVFTQKEKFKNLVAYSAINNFLRKNKLLAPKLYDHNYKRGIIIIEDFGDLSYYNILKNNSNKLNIYKELVQQLIKIEKIKKKNKIRNILNKFYYIDVYSKKYLIEESNLFFDWYLPILFKKRKTTKIKGKAKKVLVQIYKKLNFPNTCFVHRDYHSQNLMKVGKKVGLIDNQDALYGNPAYDLASLIDDVRIKTSNRLKKQIYEYYIEQGSNTYRNNSKEFLEDFNILSVQRSLKIIGIFSRLYKRDNKKEYLKFIPYAWRLLEERMNSDTFLDLKKILDKNISKKIRNKTIYK